MFMFTKWNRSIVSLLAPMIVFAGVAMATGRSQDDVWTKMDKAELRQRDARAPTLELLPQLS